VAPAVVGASLRVFDMITGDSSYVGRVRALTHRFRDAMGAAGFTLRGARDHPICPVMIGDARLASQFADEMLRRGVYVVGFSFPVVPKGLARIRTQLSAAHTEADVDKAVAAFTEVGRKLGVIKA
jgi:7-keto-8-aminopelargonate synthetase-like enzyme